MRAIFLADGNIFTTGFSRMSERQLALWNPVRPQTAPMGFPRQPCSHGAMEWAGLDGMLKPIPFHDSIPALGGDTFQCLQLALDASSSFSVGASTSPPSQGRIPP